MASDETMTIHSSTQEDDYDDVFYDVYDHDDQQPQYPLNLSRLSLCTSSSNLYENDDEDDDDYDVGHGNYYQAAQVGDNGMRMFMSRLSIESFDADEEFSDENEGKELTGLSSDSDSEQGCYSLPATPRRRNRGHGLPNLNLNHQQLIGVKEYASDNEAQKGFIARKKTRNNVRRRKIIRERCPSEKTGWENFDCNKMSKNMNMMMDMAGGMDIANSQSVSGESDQAGAGGGGGGCSGAGVMVITRPKGGSRSLCMDLEEVKACRDLGFELEHERMLEMPSRLSISGSPLDTASSGANSPIANWRISSPGDDPRDVKARLKVWAQAVALASTSRQGS